MKSIGYLLGEGFKNLWKNRTMSIASITVLVSCFLLTGIAVLLSLNLDNVMKTLESDNSITVYLDPDVSDLTAVEVGEQLRRIPNIATCELITSSDALDDIMNDLGSDGDLFIGMDSFLPNAYTISMKDLSIYTETITKITSVEHIESVSDYSHIAEILNDLDKFIQYAGIAIVSILSIVSLFILSNTLKVTMFTRRIEIQIMKSVGATNMFIRIPFFVEGILIGLISGAISGAIIYYAYIKINEFVYSIVTFIDVIDIRPYVTELFVAYAIMGILFGLTGGLISVSRYLKKEGEKAIF